MEVFNPKDAITEALAQYAPLQQQITSSLPNLDDYIINGCWDDSGYDAAKRALRDAKRVATAIDTKRKELKAVALEYGRAVDGKAKELTMLCEPTIGTLNTRIASVDMEREKIKQAKRHERQQQLAEAGYEYAFSAYRVGDQIVHAGAIDDCTAEEWQGIIDRGVEASQRVRQELQAREDERRELEAQRKELEAQRRELDAQRAELDKVVFTEQAATRTPQAATGTPPTPQAADFWGQEASHDIAPATKPAEPYTAGFDACRSLCIAIVSKGGKRSEIIAAIESLQP